MYILNGEKLEHITARDHLRGEGEKRAKCALTFPTSAELKSVREKSTAFGDWLTRCFHC